MDFRGVVEFAQVINHGSFSAAARQLGVSKAYVSQRVSQLEDRLGTRLLQRTTRKLSLTESGEVYFRYAREIMRQLEEGEERVRDFQQNPKGQLKVSIVDGGLGEWYLAPALARFIAGNPEVSLELDLSSRLVDLVSENFDFAIRVGDLEDSSLIARKLTSVRYGLYAAPAYLEQHGVVATPKELQGHNCLTGATARWKFNRGESVVEIRPKGTWHSKSGQSLIAAATEGLGVVRTASFYADKALKKGQLVEILADWSREQTPVWIVYPSGHNLPLRVRSAVNFLLEDFRDNLLGEK